MRMERAVGLSWLRFFPSLVCETIATAVADESVAVSQYAAVASMGEDRNPNGVDLSRFHPGAKTAHPTVLFVGTYLRRKRGKLLVEVFERDILPRFPAAELWMVSEDAPPRARCQSLRAASPMPGWRACIGVRGCSVYPVVMKALGFLT